MLRPIKTFPQTQETQELLNSIEVKTSRGISQQHRISHNNIFL
jgi:hypothetical protein